MSTRTTEQEVAHFLGDMYAVELQALAQLETAPRIAGEPGLADALRTHHPETEAQADLVHTRLEQIGGEPGAIKKGIMKLGGKAFVLFAKAQPETPGRLAAHAYAFEAMEWAGYEVLERLALAAGDLQTAEIAAEIRDQERLMMARLESLWDAAENASHADTPADRLHEDLRKHIAEAHAIESQSVQMLKKAREIGGADRLDLLYDEHLAESRAQARRLEQHLHMLGGSTSTTKDAILAVGAMEWGMFFQSQTDSPAKLAAFAFAFEHLEIGGYELLKRSAQRAGDTETAHLATEILGEERRMAGRLAEHFDVAVEATLAEVTSDR